MCLYKRERECIIVLLRMTVTRPVYEAIAEIELHLEQHSRWETVREACEYVDAV